MARPSLPTADFQRVILVPNHTDQAQGLAVKCHDELRENLRLPVEIHTSKPGGRAPNSEYLSTVLEEGDIVGAICGDGTFRDLALSIGKIPIISLCGGNARDIGRATQRHRNAAPSKLIQQSHVEQAYALASHIVGLNGDIRNEHAISYIGTGETAFQSGVIDTDVYREGRKIVRDLAIAIGSLSSKRWFEVVDADGQERRLSDLTFAKGPRMAKIGRFPVHHWDEQMYVVSIGEGFAAKAVAAAGLLTGTVGGSYYDTPYSFMPTTETLMHFDGDPPVVIEPFSQVNIALGESYNLLTSQTYNM